eukprot:2406577-Prymnesium_polylepis.2
MIPPRRQLRLLLGSLFAAGVTPHAPPLHGWRLRRMHAAATSAAAAPTDASAAAPTAAPAASAPAVGSAVAGGGAALCLSLLSARGETLSELLSRAVAPTLADLYPAGTPLDEPRAASGGGGGGGGVDGALGAGPTRRVAGAPSLTGYSSAEADRILREAQANTAAADDGARAAGRAKRTAATA